MVVLRDIPTANQATINQLVGALTIIQTGIVGFYFGGSKANEQTQAANIERSLKSEAVVQEIAKSVPATATILAAKTDLEKKL